MASSNTVIITCAITGAIHTPSMSPYLPMTPDEIAEATIAAAEAGAAIVHLHARDPGRTPRPDPRLFALPATHQAVDQRGRESDHRRRPLHETRGASQPARSVPARDGVAEHGLDELRPVPDARRFKEFKHGWESAYLEGAREFLFRNTFHRTSRLSCSDLGREHGTRFEFECYDVGHLYNLAHFLDREVRTSGRCSCRSVFGILGGIGSASRGCVANEAHCATGCSAKKYRWSVLGAGRNQLPIAAMAAAIGGNVRVGLEDRLWIGPGELATSNAEQVRAARQIIEGLGLSVASPDEAREILELQPPTVSHSDPEVRDTLRIELP